MQLWLRLLAITFCFNITALAQNFGPSADDEIDAALERALAPPEEKKEEASSDKDVQITSLPDVKDVSSLGELAPFKDIAVVQKRYLPKTNRFEFFPSLGVILNDSFFNNYAAQARLSYNFTEAMGIELVGIYLLTSEKDVTKDLHTKKAVVTQSLVTPKAYYGADFKWSPVYGKFSYFSKSIIPFDMYFSVGGGMTQTNSNESAGTVHVGTGQIYALSKSMAARWDVSWYFYSAKTINDSSGSFNNVYATLGLSFFFPEASYR